MSSFYAMFRKKKETFFIVHFQVFQCIVRNYEIAIIITSSAVEEIIIIHTPIF